MKTGAGQSEIVHRRGRYIRYQPELESFIHMCCASRLPPPMRADLRSATQQFSANDGLPVIRITAGAVVVGPRLQVLFKPTRRAGTHDLPYSDRTAGFHFGRISGGFLPNAVLALARSSTESLVNNSGDKVAARLRRGISLQYPADHGPNSWPLQWRCRFASWQRGRCRGRMR